MPDSPRAGGGRWASKPSRPTRQVDAVLAWLVVEADSPNAVHVHPLNAVLTWTPLLGEHLLLTEP